MLYISINTRRCQFCQGSWARSFEAQSQPSCALILTGVFANRCAAAPFAMQRVITR